MRVMRGRLPIAALLACLCGTGAVRAQIVDDVEWRRDGADAVLVVRFATEVRFQRAVATRSGDLTQVAYTLLSTTNARLGTPTQVRRVAAVGALPEVEVADEAERGERSEQTRRLVLRLSRAVPTKARGGRDNRSLEVVLTGLGAAVPAPSRPALPALRPAVVAPTPPAAPASAPAVATAPDAGWPAGVSPASPEVEARAQALMQQGRQAYEAGRWEQAAEHFGQALELPPHGGTREAQFKVGMAHLRQQDLARAIAEFETFLKLFPTGPDSDQARSALASIARAPVAPAAPTDASRPVPEPEVTIAGSASSTFHGGNGQLRSRDFQDSPIGGLPAVAGEPQLSSDRSRQLYSDVDLNWRRRNAEVDQRFVFRDSYTSDLLRPDKSRNRLSALYFDHKSLSGRWGVRAGRQSPTGAGVMGRFDGLTGYWSAWPRVKLGAVAGMPVDKVFDSKRRFHGVSIDADRLPGGVGAGLYAIEQLLDGVVDRRAVGVDLRWFGGGATVFSQVDYDVAIGALNIATLQGTYITAGNTVFNALFDRRALTTLALGNALTFEDPANPGLPSRRIADRLARSTLRALRDQVRRITPMITQAQVGVTVPLNKNWQVASSLQLTETGAIPPVPEVAGFENGRPATGAIVTTSAQLIGLNLYSARDTHVLSTTLIRSPTMRGTLLGYHQSSLLWQAWQVEPSVQFYADRLEGGTHSRRWSPGLRVSYRGVRRWALESSINVEIGRTRRVGADPLQPGATITTEESTRRVNYSLGARHEF